MSKKLEKNGLWESSRMMLPEHREALIKEQHSDDEFHTTYRALPTEGELKLIRESIILPILLTIVESNGRQIEWIASPLKKLYHKATQLLLKNIHTDLIQVKKTLKQHEIKVFEDERSEGHLHYRFLCRGHEEPFIMTRDIVRAELSLKIADYVKSIFQESS